MITTINVSIFFFSMETARGPFSGLNPSELGAAPGFPGLSTISEMSSFPALSTDHEALNELTTYADEVNQAQSLSLATKSSRTDMMAATPAQRYILDTRSSKWTITNSTQGLQPDGETNAYLASAQCVDLKTTRLAGTMSINFPNVAVAAGNYWLLPRFMPLSCFTFGVLIGANGNTLQDVGTASDQMWLSQMRMARKPFNKTDLIIDGSNPLDGLSADYVAPPNDYTNNSSVNDLVIPATGAAFTFTYSFVIRPTHSFFGIEKTWPPALPIKLIAKWNSTNTSSLITPFGAAVGQAFAVNLRIDTIRSEEIYLVPDVKQYIMNHFITNSATNMTQTAQARLFNEASLFDPTFGIPQYNAANIAAIYQFETFRLSSHDISGSSFTAHPVLNGSARPKQMVIAIQNPVKNFAASLFASPDLTSTFLTQLQVLYNGQTIWDEPFIPNPDDNNNMTTLYAESKKNARVEFGLPALWCPWWNYQKWAKDEAWIIVNMAPSHNENEIQPNDAAPVEVRGQFSQAVPTGTRLRIGLFFDQTMLVQKSNNIVLSLPIY